MKKILFSISIILLSGFCMLVPATFSSLPVFADENQNCVSTAILGNGQVCDDGSGSSVYYILAQVVNIMTIGIGILGIIGITIVGIQYLTAGGNEEKTRKAKRRMFEIVIGLVAYAVAYAALTWLLPGFGKSS